VHFPEIREGLIAECGQYGSIGAVRIARLLAGAPVVMDRQCVVTALRHAGRARRVTIGLEGMADNGRRWMLDSNDFLFAIDCDPEPEAGSAGPPSGRILAGWAPRN